jgi:N-glycosylase/DNA lyase
MNKREQIRKRLEEFKSLTDDEEYKEFLFCLLTPQSNAQRCWQAVEEISKLKSMTLEKVAEILSTKTRFHNTKAKRIMRAQKTWRKIRPILSKGEIPKLRGEIAAKVNGYGLKEASHFLRNIGLSNNSIAILDRHILRNLNEEKIKSPKHYLEVEQKFLKFAKSKKIPADELDLLWWSKENGEVFK